MEIKINVKKLIEDNEKKTLKDVMNCQSDEELKKALSQIGTAALNEYLEMILGKQLPTRAMEIKERRLYHLLIHYFDGYIPKESEISSLFQLTESQSRTLLRNVRTKFRFNLEPNLSNTITDILKSAEKSNGDYKVVIQSENILEELKHIVALEAPRLKQISMVRNSAGVYKIPVDTFDVLCKHYGIKID